MRGYLEVPDQDEFVGWLLSAVQAAPAPARDLRADDDFIDAVAARVAERLQGSYAPPGLQTFVPPAPALTYATQPPPAAPVPAPAGTLDLNRLTPLQRALVNAMLPSR